MKKKRNLRIVALMLLVALIIPCYANAGDGEALKDKMLTDEEQLELMLKQASAMEAYEQLMDAWVDESGGLAYPNAFGGFYHTDDFKLAVKVVGGDERFMAEVIEIVDNPGIIRFVETDISFKELVALQQSISDEYPNLEFSSGISQVDSTVNISICEKAYGLRQNAPSLIKLAGTPHVSVTVTDEPATMYSTNYDPGRMIFGEPSSASALTGVGTLGWYGTYNFPNRGRVDCFLTAGHVQIAFQRDVLDMYFGNTKVFSKDDYPETSYSTENCVVVCGGKRTKNFWPEGNSYGDLAMMACESPGVPDVEINASNKIYINTTTMTVTDYFGSGKRLEILQGKFDPSDKTSVEAELLPLIPANTRVAKGWGVGGRLSNGSLQSMATYGVISDICTDYNYNNSGALGASGSKGIIWGCIQIDPQSTTKPFAISGDSGGPVYYVKSNGKVSLLGIVSGGREGETYTYITPTTIMVMNGFIPYVG